MRCASYSLRLSTGPGTPAGRAAGLSHERRRAAEETVARQLGLSTGEAEGEADGHEGL